MAGIALWVSSAESTAGRPGTSAELGYAGGDATPAGNSLSWRDARGARLWAGGVTVSCYGPGLAEWDDLGPGESSDANPQRERVDGAGTARQADIGCPEHAYQPGLAGRYDGGKGEPGTS